MPERVWEFKSPGVHQFMKKQTKKPKKQMEERDCASYFRSYEPTVAALVDHLEWCEGRCFHTFDLQDLFTKKMIAILKKGDDKKRIMPR